MILWFHYWNNWAPHCLLVWTSTKKTNFCLLFIDCGAQSRAAQDIWCPALKVLFYQKMKGGTQLPKASDRYQSCVWRRKKWVHFLLDARHKINPAIWKTTYSNLRLNFPTFRFFAVYCDPLLGVRSTSSMLEEIGVNIWAFTNLKLLKESPKPPKTHSYAFPRHAGAS